MVGTLPFKPVNDFGLTVGLGALRNTNGFPYLSVGKFGTNRIVPTTGTDIWTTGGDIPFQTGPSTVRIEAGGHGADNPTGQGARKIIVFGLDDSLNMAQEEIETNGVNASASTVTSFFRVFSVHVSDVGNYGAANFGAIGIETTGGTFLIGLGTDDGGTQFGSFSVPADYTAFIESFTVTVESRKEVSVQLFSRGDIDSVVNATPNQAKRQRRSYQSLNQGSHHFKYIVPIRVEGKSDIWVHGNTASGTSGTSVDFELFMVPNK